MKTFLKLSGVFYILLGIAVPVLLIKLTNPAVLNPKEWVLGGVISLISLSAGLFFFILAGMLTSIKEIRKKLWLSPPAKPSEKAAQPQAQNVPLSGHRPRRATLPGQRFKTRMSPKQKVARAPRPAPAPNPARSATRPAQPAQPTGGPDFDRLVTDLKNFIKLENWSLALQKANALLHYYPDSPEADRVRDNLNFLTQKVKENPPEKPSF